MFNQDTETSDSETECKRINVNYNANESKKIGNGTDFLAPKIMLRFRNTLQFAFSINYCMLIVTLLNISLLILKFNKLFSLFTPLLDHLLGNRFLFFISVFNIYSFLIFNCFSFVGDLSVFQVNSIVRYWTICSRTKMQWKGIVIIRKFRIY